MRWWILLGDHFWIYSRIQRCLVRQWIHVSVSLRRRGACWLRCTSRCVPSWFSGPGALRHGRYGPAGAVYGAVQKTAEIPQLQFIMVVVIPVITQRLIPMVLLTIETPQLPFDTVPGRCFSCRRDFVGDDFMFSPYSALSLVRPWIHILRWSTENFAFFYVKRWITDPEVDSRLSGVSASLLWRCLRST